MASERSASPRREHLRVTSVERPGWAAGDGRLPKVGEAVCCAEGEAEVVRLLGRTGDGGRLLELRLPDRPKHPYFAASSNVLRRAAAEGGVDEPAVRGDLSA